MADYFAFVTKEGLGAMTWCLVNPPNTVLFTDVAVGDLGGGAFPSFWSSGNLYTSGTVIVGNNKSLYTCILDHTSTALDDPGIGINWTTYWVLRTSLINEQYRSPVNSVYVHPNNPNWIVVEGIVPDDQGGWWVSEVGLYADPGTGPILFGVAKFPPSYKPVLADGSGKDFYIRIILVITDVNTITLIMDPSVVLATQVYVNNYAYWATEADRIWNGVVFESDVVQDDVVYYNPATNKFGRAIADGSIKQRALGFADLLPNYRNVNGQILTHNECPYTFAPLTPGATYYLSPTLLGKITTTPPNRYTVKVGTARAIGVMLVDIDDILSGYEDVAFTSINSSGDVVLVRDLSVGRDLSVVNTLQVGSENGFPAFHISNAGDVYVTGGSDGHWAIFNDGYEAISVDSTFTTLGNRASDFHWSITRASGDWGSASGHFRIDGGNTNLSSDIHVTGGTDSDFGFWHCAPHGVGVKVWGINPYNDIYFFAGPTRGWWIENSSGNLHCYGDDFIVDGTRGNTAGNVTVTGGTDGRWSLFQNGLEAISVDSTFTTLGNRASDFHWSVTRASGDFGSASGHFRIVGGDDTLSSDIWVSGGTDGYWGLFHVGASGTTDSASIYIPPTHDVALRGEGVQRAINETPTANSIVAAHASGKIDAGWLPTAPVSFSYVYGDVTRGLSLSPVSIIVAGPPLTKQKEIRTLRNGNFRILFEVNCMGGSTNTNTVFAQIYKNGSPIGTPRSHTSAIATWENEWFTEDIPGWVANDLIQVYGYHTGGGGDGYASISSLDVRADEDLLAIL